MATILKQRRDTAANWSSANPVIPEGQLCFDITNNTFRIGDGTTNYSSLIIQSGVPGAAGGMQGSNNLSELTNTVTGRSNLGVVIGTDVVGVADIGTTVQAYDADTSKTDVAETRTASINMADNVLQRPELKDYSETKVSMAANDVDLSAGNVFTKTISGATTLTFSNPPATGKGGAFTLILTNGGSATITWPTSVDWASATAPVLTAAGIDMLTFTTIDGGTIWYGIASGIGMA
jgi:hypothetical protein